MAQNHLQTAQDSTLRRRSVANAENQDDTGLDRAYELQDMSAADRELAQKFGYKPVSSDPMLVTSSSLTLFGRSSSAN